MDYKTVVLNKDSFHSHRNDRFSATWAHRQNDRVTRKEGEMERKSLRLRNRETKCGNIVFQI